MRTLTLYFAAVLATAIGHAQNKPDVKEQRFIQQIDTIVEELKFNYEYDQALREYIFYKTFDKCFTDSIENIKDNDQRLDYIYSTNFKSDLAKKIWKDFIHPADDRFTQTLIDICNSTGYPSLKRIRAHYKGAIPEDFNPVLFFIHSQKSFWPDIIQIAEREFREGRMGPCDYGYIRWHTSGRQENKFLDDHGIKYHKNSAGRAVMIETCEDK